MDENKRKEYNRRRREAYRQRKNERRREIVTSTYSERRLHFVRVIMKERHLTQSELAKRLGESRQAVHQLFAVTDDTNLSKIKMMLNACGCSCSVELSPISREDRMQRKAEYDFTGDFAERILDGGSVPADNIRYPAFVQASPSDANLHFLADFIISTNLSITDFCSMVKLSRQTLSYAFQTDDIRLSKLCQIANNLNAKIVWNINDLVDTLDESKHEQ